MPNAPAPTPLRSRHRRRSPTERQTGGAAWTRPLASAVLAVLAVLAVTMSLRRPGLLVGLDQLLYTRLAGTHPPGVDVASRGLLLLGQRGVLFPLVVVLAVRSWRRGDRRLAWQALAAVMAAAAVVAVIKVALPRPAPHAGLGALLGEAGQSFPSGHAAGAAVCWWGVLLLLRPARNAARRAAAAAAGLASGTAMLLLGYHWFSDVVAGWLIAVAVLTVASRAAPRSSHPIARSGEVAWPGR